MASLSERELAHATVRKAFEHIQALVVAFEQAQSPEEEQRACEAIRAEAPQIAVRSNWHRPGEPEYISEYRILISSGSPTIQVIGDIEGDEPYTARLGYQDWFTRWQECELTEEEERQLLSYAQCFTYSK